MTDTLTPVQTSRLAADRLSLGYAERAVVRELSLAVLDSKVTVIVGPNGCGKSTLLRGLARLLKPSSGTVVLEGRSIHEQSSREVARRLGFLPQNPVAPEGLTVVDLVGRGRHPHHGPFRRWTIEDDAAVARALEATDTLALAKRPVDQLSGGQRQRVWIAMVLAQETDLMLLDEPTTYLDIAHQVEVLDLVRGLNRLEGRTVVAVLHDLNQAVRYADHLVVMKDGAIVREGAPAAVLTAELVHQVFGLPAVVVDDPVTGDPMVVPQAHWLG